MEIHQLEYFVAIVDAGGFSRAAERCNVAQPSLSQQIRKLENEIGQPLFDRLGRKVALTEAGKILLPRARTILGELQDIKIDLQTEIQDGHSTLSVGFIPTIAPFVLPAVIRRFSLAYPNAKLLVHEDLTENLIEKIISAELDVGITSLPIKNKLIRTEELLTETLYLAAPRTHEIINRSVIPVKDLDDYPFIALSEVHCLGEQVQSFCYQQDVDLDIVCYTTQLSTVRNCIALGLGVSLIPEAMLIKDPLEQIVCRPISDLVPQRKIAAAVHARRRLSALGKSFIEIVREEYPKNQT